MFCGGRERKKNEFLQKKTLIQQQTRKKCSKNLFPSRISFFPICLFSSLLFSFPKKTKILFLLFKFVCYTTFFLMTLLVLPTLLHDFYELPRFKCLAHKHASVSSISVIQTPLSYRLYHSCSMFF